MASRWPRPWAAPCWRRAELAQLDEPGDRGTGPSAVAPGDAVTLRVAALDAVGNGPCALDADLALELPAWLDGPRRARVTGANRIELTGFSEPMRDRLRAYGLFGEIISWKLRFFVPVDASGSAILARVLERYPVLRIADRAAA